VALLLVPQARGELALAHELDVELEVTGAGRRRDRVHAAQELARPVRIRQAQRGALARQEIGQLPAAWRDAHDGQPLGQVAPGENRGVELLVGHSGGTVAMIEPATQPTDDLPDLLSEEPTDRGPLLRVALLVATAVLFVLAIIFWLIP